MTCVGSWDAGIGDDKLGRLHGARYVRRRGRLGPHMATAIRLGQLADVDPEDLAVRCVRARRFPAEIQIRFLDEFLNSLE